MKYMVEVHTLPNMVKVVKCGTFVKKGVGTMAM